MGKTLALVEKFWFSLTELFTDHNVNIKQLLENFKKCYCHSNKNVLELMIIVNPRSSEVHVNHR